MLREIENLSDQEVANLIKDAFAEVRASVDRPYVVLSADPWFERQEQRHLSEEHALDLARQRDTGSFSPEVTLQCVAKITEAAMVDGATIGKS